MPGAGRRGYVLDVQARLLDHFATRAMVPLLPLSNAPPPIAGLNPVFDVDGAPHVMPTQAIAGIPVRELKRAVASLDREHDPDRTGARCAVPWLLNGGTHDRHALTGHRP
jgi:toxin CcdB